MTNLEAVSAWLMDRPALLSSTPDLVALAQTLAGALDAEPDNAALAREYRMTLGELRTAGDVGDGETDVTAELSTAVGDVS